MVAGTLLTYEEGSRISEKFKRRIKTEYERERDVAIAEMWREVGAARLMADHVEIQDGVILSVHEAVPFQYRTMAAVMPVPLNEKREIRPPMPRMFFIRIDGEWKIPISSIKGDES